MWLLIFGVPDALLLAILVALFDLIPMVGSTVAGVIVSLVALSKGIPIGIATLAFYIVYRYVEDYLLNPRVMKHTVKVTPGLTIIATLIGGTLLGLSVPWWRFRSRQRSICYSRRSQSPVKTSASRLRQRPSARAPPNSSR